MKRKGCIRLAGVLCVMVFCLGCENEVYGPLSRTREDPFPDVPGTDSFRRENRVYLDWKGDEGADEYILMRSPDGAVYDFREIWRGKGTSYVDTGVAEYPSDSRFVYRLDKMRGKAYFKGKGTALGVNANFRKDDWENNDTEGWETRLLWEKDANLYFYRFNDNRVLSDTDWYYYTVPARTKVLIVFSQTDTGGLDCDFVAYVPGGTEQQVTPETAIPLLTNTGETPRDMKIRVTPGLTVPSGKFNFTGAGGTGGTSINYTIKASGTTGT